MRVPDYEEVELTVERMGMGTRRVSAWLAIRPRNVARLQRLADKRAKDRGLVAGSIELRPHPDPAKYAFYQAPPTLVTWRCIRDGYGFTRERLDAVKADVVRAPPHLTR